MPWSGGVTLTLKSAIASSLTMACEIGATATAQSRLALEIVLASAIPPSTAEYTSVRPSVYGGPAFVVGGPRKERDSGS